MQGANVGGLHQRVFEAALVAKHGGIFNQTDNVEFKEGVMELIKRLKNQEIDGFVLDKYSYMFACYIIESSDLTSTEYEGYDDYFFTKTRRTEKKTSEKLSYGILVTNVSDFEFFRPYMMDNRHFLSTCDTLALNFMSKERKVSGEGLFSASSHYFKMSLLLVFSIIVCICCFGLCFELNRKKGYKLCEARTHYVSDH